MALLDSTICFRVVDLKPFISFRFLRQVLALGCVWAYLAATIPLLPLAMAGLAWVDGDHRVSIGFTGKSLKIILAHDPADPAKAPEHIHCALTQGVLLLSEACQDGAPDHVLQFHQGHSPSQRENRAPSLVTSPGQSPASLSTVAFILPSPAKELRPRLVLAPPSPNVVRTTVLLI